MRKLTGKCGRLCSKIAASGLVLLLILAGVLPPQAAAKLKSDWSRVQAVTHNTKAVVLLYQDEAPRENRRIKGRFDSATADSITLVLEDGQRRTLQKSAVRKVLTPLPFRKRGAGWATLVVASVLVGILWLVGGTSGAEPGEVPGISASVIGVPTLIAFLGAKMGPVYDVPPKHRVVTQADQQSGNQDNVSRQQEEPLRD